MLPSLPSVCETEGSSDVFAYKTLEDTSCHPSNRQSQISECWKYSKIVPVSANAK